MNFYSILCSEVKDFLDFQLLKMVENNQTKEVRDAQYGGSQSKLMPEVQQSYTPLPRRIKMRLWNREPDDQTML